MRSNRSTLAALMVVVAIIAVILAALRSRTEAWNNGFFLIASVLYLLGFVVAATRAGRRRARALGFAGFGAAYLVLCLVIFDPSDLSLAPVVARIEAGINKPLLAGTSRVRVGGICGTSAFPDRDLIGDCLASLIVAATAGLVAPLLISQDNPMKDDPLSRPQARRWLRVVGAALIVLLGLGAVGVGLDQAPGPTAALALLGTGAFFALGLVVAVSSQGNRRAGWLGFALFGAGYLTLVFGPESLPVTWPRLIGDQLINAVASVLPHSAGSEISDPSDPFALANRQVQAVLDRPAVLNIQGEVSLDEFVQAVRRVAICPDGRPIPIHVDPQGLQDADKTLDSHLMVDIDGVRLRTALRFALRQLYLTVHVVDGVLLVTSLEVSEPLGTTLPIHVVGHCILGLLTAVLGGLVARRVAGPRPEPV